MRPCERIYYTARCMRAYLIATLDMQHTNVLEYQMRSLQHLQRRINLGPSRSSTLFAFLFSALRLPNAELSLI